MITEEQIDKLMKINQRILLTSLTVFVLFISIILIIIVFASNRPTYKPHIINEVLNDVNTESGNNK